MRLFISNETRQKQRLNYRLDFNMEGQPASQDGVLPKHQDILPGRQEAIGGELKHVSQADGIITQLRRFGAIDLKEINRQTKFAPYIFSVDKPIPEKAIKQVFAYNNGILTSQGAVRRDKAAIAATEVIQSENVTIGIEQVSESEYGGEQIADGVIVDKTAPPPDPAGAKGHRASRLKGPDARG